MYERRKSPADSRAVLSAQNQFGTYSRYHPSPERRLKSQNRVPKCRRSKGLASRRCTARRIGETRALREAVFDFIYHNPTHGEEMHMVDLAQVKVTPRDQQVLNLLVQGCSNKEIAGQLNISPRTVKQHLRTLFLRAGIREGRKRVKLAIAMFATTEELSKEGPSRQYAAQATFAKEEVRSCPRASALRRKKSGLRLWSGRV